MKIVVAIDGSPHADRALAWARREAQLRRASLTVLHAFGVHRFTRPLHVDEGHERDRGAGETLVREALRRVTGDAHAADHVELTPVRGRGATAAVLRATADADLVVLGSRGLGGFPGLLLGSVSQQVAAHAAVPVAVIPRGDDGDSEPDPTRAIVVGVDDSAAARAALAWAGEEAALRSVPITAVHVRRSLLEAPLDDGTTAGGVMALEERALRHARTTLAALINDTLGPDRQPVMPRVVTGEPAPVLIGHAAAPSSMLVVGSRGRGGFAGLLLGSVSQQCLQHAKGPVVVTSAR